MTINDEFLIVEYMELPRSVKGCVTPLEDGRYIIVINSSLSKEEQNEALQHELKHIERGDLLPGNYADVSEIEFNVHNDVSGGIEHGKG